MKILEIMLLQQKGINDNILRILTPKHKTLLS